MLLICKVPWGRKGIFEQKFAFKFRFPVIFFFAFVDALKKLRKFLVQRKISVTLLVESGEVMGFWSSSISIRVNNLKKRGVIL